MDSNVVTGIGGGGGGGGRERGSLLRSRNLRRHASRGLAGVA